MGWGIWGWSEGPRMRSSSVFLAGFSGNYARGGSQNGQNKSWRRGDHRNLSRQHIPGVWRQMAEDKLGGSWKGWMGPQKGVWEWGRPWHVWRPEFGGGEVNYIVSGQRECGRSQKRIGSRGQMEGLDKDNREVISISRTGEKREEGWRRKKSSIKFRAENFVIEEDGKILSWEQGGGADSMGSLSRALMVEKSQWIAGHRNRPLGDHWQRILQLKGWRQSSSS